VSTESTSMQGRVCMLVEGTDGLGKETAVALAKLGAKIVLVGPDMEESTAAAKEVRHKSGSGAVEFFVCDMSSMQEVRILAQHFHQHYDRLDVLVNHISHHFAERTLNDNDIEMTFAVNHLGMFLLLTLLIDPLRRAGGRILTVTSPLFKRAKLNIDDLQFEKHRYDGTQAYIQSRLVRALSTMQLARRLDDTNITAHIVNPGYVESQPVISGGGLFGWIGRLFYPIEVKPDSVGARSIVFAATSPEPGETTGLYVEENKVVDAPKQLTLSELARELWTLSEELSGANETMILGAKLR